MIEIKILPDGQVLMPKDPRLESLVSSLGDKKMAAKLAKASKDKIIIGKRMCG